MSLLVEVILPVFLEGTFYYKVHAESVHELGVGKRVLVPFGRGNKLFTGLIKQILQSNDENLAGYKTIHQVLDPYPLVSHTMLTFWEWLSNYYFCSLGDILNFALPPHLSIQVEWMISLHEDIAEIAAHHPLSIHEQNLLNALAKPISRAQLEKSFSPSFIEKYLKKGWLVMEQRLINPYKPKQVSFVYLNPTIRADFYNAVNELRTKEQQEILLFLYQHDGVQKSILLQRLGVSATVCKALEKKGWISVEEHPIERTQFFPKSLEHIEADKQIIAFGERVFTEISSQNVWKPVLVHHDLVKERADLWLLWIKNILAQKKQILILVPEIYYADYFTEELENYLGGALGVYHSRMEENERVELWYKVMDGTYKVVIGVRAALFLPFKNLGLIIIDEEQSPMYKQEETSPRLHFRDSAIYLAKSLNIPVILLAITPSIESYYHAQQKKYALHTYLHKPIVSQNHIQLYDTNFYYAQRLSHGVLVLPAYKQLKANWLHGKQAVLFINKRGHSSMVFCKNCGYVYYCKNCDITLTYHKHSEQLRCHYCGYAEPFPTQCRHCSSHNLDKEGFGTEKIEEQLQSFLAEFKVSRMDSDTIKTPKQYFDLLNHLKQGKIDVLIGTQWIKKVLDNPNIQLVILLFFDYLLYLPHFRAAEYAFQFLRTLIYEWELIGASEKQMLIQTIQPKAAFYSYLFKDYVHYFEEQLVLREQLGYPPFSRIIEIELQHTRMEVLQRYAPFFLQALYQNLSINILGPTFPSVERLKNYYRACFLIKLPTSPAAQSLKKIIKQNIKSFLDEHHKEKFRVFVNIDPR